MIVSQSVWPKWQFFLRLAIVLAVALGLWTCDAPTEVEKGEAAFEIGDYETALMIWRPLTEEGNARAQFWLGHMYRTGQGVEEDVTKALVWFRKAAAQDDVMAEYNLGVLYSMGTGVPKDLEEGVHWFRKSAGHGDVDAISTLDWMYAEGEWAPRDLEQTRSWYKKVLGQADAGSDPDLQFTLGQVYLKGNLIGADPEEAARWFRKAALRYHVSALLGDDHDQCMLAGMYAKGVGVPQSDMMFRIWRALGSDKENQIGACLVELLRFDLSVEEIFGFAN